MKTKRNQVIGIDVAVEMMKAAIDAMYPDLAKKIVQVVREEDKKSEYVGNKRQHDTRLWNTRSLLHNYKALKEYCRHAIYEQDELNEDALEILQSLGYRNRKTYIESIKSSVARTVTIMAHVDAMLELYKQHCEGSGRIEDQRKYRILCAVYFEKQTLAQICQAENIDRSTYYRDNKDNIEMISALIFGVDGLLAMRQR